jgi:hypothetical protein
VVAGRVVFVLIAAPGYARQRHPRRSAPVPAVRSGLVFSTDQSRRSVS